MSLRLKLREGRQKSEREYIDSAMDVSPLAQHAALCVQNAPMERFCLLQTHRHT